MNERVRDVLPLVAWMAALGVAIVAFTAMGSGQLAAPPMDPGAWSGWADARDPVVATVALLRLVVLGLAWYLAGVTVVGALARVARLTTMVRVTDAATVPVVRRVLQTSLGVGLATAVVVSSTATTVPRSHSGTVLAAAAATEVDRDVPTMRPLPPGVAPVPASPPDQPAPSPSTDPAPTSVPTQTNPARDTPDPIPSADDAGPREHAPTSLDGSAHLPTAGEASAATVTVAPGDHLWSIAERHLAEAHGRDVADDEITPYWRRLVEANRDRLVDPTNPDLILPGQQFVLPDIEVVP